MHWLYLRFKNTSVFHCHDGFTDIGIQRLILGVSWPHNNFTDRWNILCQGQPLSSLGTPLYLHKCTDTPCPLWSSQRICPGFFMSSAIISNHWSSLALPHMHFEICFCCQGHLWGQILCLVKGNAPSSTFFGFTCSGKVAGLDDLQESLLWFCHLAVS